MTKNQPNSAHILVFPYPTPGHMMPLLDLTHQLANRGLRITILVTAENLPILNSLLSKHPSIESLVLPFPPHTSLPPGAEQLTRLSPSLFPTVMRKMRTLQTPIVKWFQNHPSPPTAIISDMFLWWTGPLAQELKVRRFVFSPSGVMAMLVIYSLRQYPPENDDSDDSIRLISPVRIPNSPIYPRWQLEFLYRTRFEEEDEVDPITEFMRDGILANMASWGLVFNSFSALERVYIDQVVEEAGHNRVWTVGPLLLLKEDLSGPNETEQSGILSWLDTCSERAVVYVCFGSQAVLSNDQMQAIAIALEKSGARFVWCVKEGGPRGHVEGSFGMIPLGFEDRVAGRGLVLRQWAPQMKILSHRAVGAFLTHCGWNSVLEGLVAGVQMLAWPMEGEQFLNATLLVDEVKAGVRVCEGAQTVPDSVELARAVAEVMSKAESETDRAREWLRKAALDATREGGSSFKDLDRLAMHLSQL
ncbi:hypothetical protein NMG60_11005823 [Bertholletia excelsa]